MWWSAFLWSYLFDTPAAISVEEGDRVAAASIADYLETCEPERDPVSDPSVTLWLNILDPRTDWGTSGTLFSKQLPTSFMPRTGDTVYAIYEDDEWAYDVEVRNTYWNGDGTAHVEMTPVVVNPEHGKPRRVGTTAWWFDDLNADQALAQVHGLLRDSGWTTDG